MFIDSFNDSGMSIREHAESIARFELRNEAYTEKEFDNKLRDVLKRIEQDEQRLDKLEL